MFTHKLKTIGIVEPAEIIISPIQSPLRVNVGGHLPIYCIAVQGVPIPDLQWFSEGFPVYSEPLRYQQIYVVPTDSPRTTTYTCVRITCDLSRQTIISELRKNVTVIVEGKNIQSTYITDYVVLMFQNLVHTYEHQEMAKLQSLKMDS